MKDFLVKWFNALKTTERRWLRRAVAVLLVLGGVFGFLPVLGYWMLPLGLALLAVDFPAARRINRLLQVCWGRLRQRFGSGNSGEAKRAALAAQKNRHNQKHR